MKLDFAKCVYVLPTKFIVWWNMRGVSASRWNETIDNRISEYEYNFISLWHETYYHLNSRISLPTSHMQIRFHDTTVASKIICYFYSQAHLSTACVCVNAIALEQQLLTTQNNVPGKFLALIKRSRRSADQLLQRSATHVFSLSHQRNFRALVNCAQRK